MSPEPTRPVPISVQITKHLIGKEGKERAFVTPSLTQIGKDVTKAPSVQWQNDTGSRATLWFPNGADLFVPPEKGGFENPIVIEVGAVLTLYVKEKPTEGHYHYHLSSEATRDCALGDSEPRMSCP
jgi:hypothetical protein